MSPTFAFLKPITDAFKAAGHEIYLVGGSVRDFTLGHPIKDFDFATSALPEVTKDLLERAGARVVDKLCGNYGTIHCVWQGQDIEITTYRMDKDYPTGDRRPVVEFSNNLEDDLRRRDFTVNAMVMDPDRQGVLVNQSPTCSEGWRDLHERRVLTTPIPADKSMSDDPLRILRAYRFSARLALRISDGLRQAMRRYATHLKFISRERIQQELIKIAEGPRPDLAFRQMMEDGVMAQIFPELTQQVGFDQDNPHHHLPLWEHTLLTVYYASAAEKRDYRVILAALLHDIAKPVCQQPRFICNRCETRRKLVNGAYGDCECGAKLHERVRTGMTYQGHGGEGARLASGALRALKFSNDDCETVFKLIEAHDGYYGVKWDTRMVRRFANRMGNLVDPMLDLMIADRLAHAPGQDDASEYTRLRRLIRELPEDLGTIKPIVNGDFVMRVTGLKPGPELGALMKEVKRLTVDGDLKTETEVLEWLLAQDKLGWGGKRIYLGGRDE